MHYCQKLAGHQIANFRPDWNVKQAIIQAKQQLQNSLLEWSYNTFGLSLEPEKEQMNSFGIARDGISFFLLDIVQHKRMVIQVYFI